MAKKIISDLDLNQNEIQNAVVQNLASAPSNPVTGQTYYNTSDNTVYIHNGTSWTALSGGGSGDVPTGVTMEFAGTTVPEGYLLCDGSAVSRTTYANLFSAIGTSWGVGNGSTTFNVPNKKGRVGVGLDTSQTEFNTLGKTGGAKVHKHFNGMASYNSNRLLVSNDGAVDNVPVLQGYTVNGVTGFTGVGNVNAWKYKTEEASSEPPYAVFNYIIKT